ncbi:hypothetical protein V6N12_031111 [Hibiscus sabdariffa]|uniref:Uncharacterized protein n=1 Tax=Hibiscus sabdariffa TaxID=183260 RepID=A0ABR2E7Z4_9ROSI
MGQLSKSRTDPVGQLCIGNTWPVHKRVSGGADAGKDVMLCSCIMAWCNRHMETTDLAVEMSPSKFDKV